MTRIDRESILEHFAASARSGDSELFDNITYHLIRMILQGSQFDSLEALIDYCADPDNLRDWLPSEVDRRAFAKRLTHGLRRLSSASSADRDLVVA